MLSWVRKTSGFELTSGYYSIQGNIDDPECVFFVSQTPTQEEYFNFARGVAAYFFIIHQGKTVISQIVVMPKKEGVETSLYYSVQNPATGETINVECGVSGDIAEKRAEELLQLGIESAENAVQLWEEIQGQKLTEPEKQVLAKGYGNE